MGVSLLGTGDLLKTIACDTWDNFVAQVRSTHFAGSSLFRGQRDASWKLSSKWERILLNMKGGDTTRNHRELFSEEAFEEIRNSYLDRFKHWVWETGAIAVRENELSEDEWWAIGRHHGLVTPLLDWSFSPYVAAYFAFVDLLEDQLPGFSSGTTTQIDPSFAGNIVVWRLNWVPEGLTIPGEFEVLTPRSLLAARQIRQRGAFTRLTHDIYADIETYLTESKKDVYLERYDIPVSEITHAMTDLRLMGINQVTLFQDLESAAREANIWFSLSRFTTVWVDKE